MTVEITRTEHTATTLRRHAACSADVSVARRLPALALVLDGRKRADAARAAGMVRQTLRDWVHRYNADGLTGLGDRHGGGAPSRLSPEQEAEVADWMRRGPDVEADGVVRWRCVDIQARFASERSKPKHCGAPRALCRKHIVAQRCRWHGLDDHARCGGGPSNQSPEWLAAGCAHAVRSRLTVAMPAVLLVHPLHLDRFLPATVGIERGGMNLSVLSMLARLDRDPWAEAARLARLPRAAAAASLADAIANMPMRA